MSQERDFDKRVEIAIEKYMVRKNFEPNRRQSLGDPSAFDKYVEKEKLLLQITNIFQEVAKMTTNSLLEPLKHHMEQIENELSKVKELVLKSFKDKDQQFQVKPIESVDVTVDKDSNDNQMSQSVQEKLKKKLQNHQNLINLLMENQAQLRGQAQQVSTIQPGNDDEIYQKVWTQVDSKIAQIKKEFQEQFQEVTRQMKEKNNACWVVLGDLNTRLEDMARQVTPVDQKAEKKSLFKRATTYMQKQQ